MRNKKEKNISNINLNDNRIIYLNGEINDIKSKEIIEVLLKLDSINNKPITMYINSNGGEVSSGLAIYDIMNKIKSDVYTICIGRAASMASILLMNGTKGKRFITPNAEVMIHQVSSLVAGKIEEMQENINHSSNINDKLIKLIVCKTKLSKEKVKKIIYKKDVWMDSKKALQYGFIDKVLY